MVDKVVPFISLCLHQVGQIDAELNAPAANGWEHAIEAIGKPNEEAFRVGYCRRRCNHPAYCAPTILQFIVLFTIPWNCDEEWQKTGAPPICAATCRGICQGLHRRRNVVDYSVVLQAQGTIN